MTTILTPDILETIAPISQALGSQTDMLTPFIEVSEMQHLKDGILGTALYDSIISDIENSTLSGNSETLVISYLYNVSAWYTFYDSSIFIWGRAEAKGLTIKASDNSNAMSTDELAIYRQSVLEKAMYWRNATIAFLTKEEENFPLWRCTDDNPIDKSDDFSSGIWV